MPELPEVETVRRGLMEHFGGRTLVKVELRREGLRFPFPESMDSRLEGRKIISIERRAKYLLIRLSGELTWLVHLGMSGSLRLVDFDAPLGRHDHIDVLLDDGACLTGEIEIEIGQLVRRFGEAARNAGLPIVLVSYGYTLSPPEEPGADVLI